jgi:hypothetical protein
MLKVRMTGRNSAAESSGHSLADRVHAIITCLTLLTDAGGHISWVRESESVISSSDHTSSITMSA